VPFAVSLAAVALMLVGFARPEMVIDLPRSEGTVILAFDVSNSMLADDLAPSRIEAAKEAARGFVEGQPPAIEIGVVAFSDGGLVTQPPTGERAEVLAAIDRLSAQGGTSLGQGIFTALNAIAGGTIAGDTAEVAELDIGYHGSAAIVLLSDGEDTTGLDPLATADLAATAGVRIFPIGIGSAGGALVELDGFTVATRLDEPTLEAVAASTGGAYYRAEDAAELAQVYDTIDLQLTIEGEKTEVTGIAAGLAVFLLLIGAGLSMAWFGRVP
jgi:Ca-activated chloride channel family protein